jgi:hypothetical protein
MKYNKGKYDPTLKTSSVKFSHLNGYVYWSVYGFDDESDLVKQLSS